MLVESVTILYYSIATVSLGLVLCNKYNTNIKSCFYKIFYNYNIVNTSDSDDDEYISFDTIHEHDTHIEHNLNIEQNVNIKNYTNDENVEDNHNVVIEKKNIVLDFE